MKTENWNASHLGKKVRVIGSNSDNHYRLEAITYKYGSNSVCATLVTIVPSGRPGVLSYFDLTSIELVKE